MTVHPCPAAVPALLGLLRQLAAVIESLTDDEYARQPVGVVESSVGGHVRHNLDHVAALLQGLGTGAVSYDDRARGTAVERDRSAALAAIARLERELGEYPWHALPATLTVTTLVAPDRPPVTAGTSPDRELAFVVGHTVHHNALIRVIVKLLGAAVPAEFGYAPATVAHHRSLPCAR